MVMNTAQDRLFVFTTSVENAFAYRLNCRMDIIPVSDITTATLGWGIYNYDVPRACRMP